MKKVLYLIDTLEIGGAESSILEIASRLKEWRPIVISIYEGNTLKPRFEKAGIKVYSLNIEQKFGISFGLKQMGNIIKNETPDLIHATLFRAEQFSRKLGPKYNIPVLNSFVNDSYSSERFNSIPLKQKLALHLYKTVDRYTAPKADAFMSITSAIIPSNTKALGLSPRDIEVIYRGRDIEKFRKKSEDQALNLSQCFETTTILTVSRLLKRKGYMESIKAMVKVVKKYPKLQYLIAGEGHDRPFFENLIKELNLEDNVKLLGNRNDIPGLLKSADLFLFPSHYEGQGGALVEAMIMGTPILASRIPVIEESVKDNYSARLFELKNSDDMANQILWALDHPEEMKQLGVNARKEAVKRFEIEKVARQHEMLYNRILEKYAK
jgi:glycosyltransferase involved in cell wall biosynthesis